MIICYINGKKCYPAASSNIKITLQNPFVKDGDEKSMEVVFPMAIPENLAVFGAVNRLDTQFGMPDFENCRLEADAVEIIRGTGTITSVTNTEVKIQILSGKSYLKYKSSFNKVFIDKLFYGDIKERHMHFKGKRQQTTSVFDLSGEIRTQGFVGEPGMYAFLPIKDETNEWFCNMPAYLYDKNYQPVGVSCHFKAVQPNLMYVMKVVLQNLGYELTSNYFDRDPWNKLYVASARMTTVLSRALPHWSAYKFLDEFRKLFNATFVFDEYAGTVKILPFGDSENAEVVEIEPVDDFTTSFDEEGIEYLGSSNLEYSMSGCHDEIDTFSQDVLKGFEQRECASVSQMYDMFVEMTERQRMTTLFHCPAGYYYCACYEDNNGENNYSLKEFGWFAPLVRKEGQSTVELKICPVAMKHQEAHCYVLGILDFGYDVEPSDTKGYRIQSGQTYCYEGLVASVDVDYEPNENVKWYGEREQEPANNLDYVTLQDVLENRESVPDSEEDDDSLLEVFFATGVMVSKNVEKWGTDYGVGYEITHIDQPLAITDMRQAGDYSWIPRWSLGLNMTNMMTCVGQYHNNGLKVNSNVNGNNEIVVNFKFDGKPDPRKIYMFRNKKFLASRIEMNVNENGIDPIKTGYFYEIL